MGLDGIGQSPLVQESQVINLITEKARRKLVNQVDSLEEKDASFSAPNEEGKLAKILAILERSRERKEKKKTNAVTAYKDRDIEKDSVVGGIIDIKA